MKRLLLPLAVVLLCVACSDDDSSETPHNSLQRVVIAYIMGENSLSGDALADLNEMRSAIDAIPANNRLVVFFDNSSTTQTPQILSFDSANGEQVLYEYPDDVVSTDGAVMEEALQYIINSNVAEEYALILWSHGSGWIPQNNKAKHRTIGIDNGNNTTSNSGQEMEIATLKEVLHDVGIQWEYILYDACFMQCIEVAYELRSLTRWSLASVAEIPDTGAPYDILMPYLFEGTNYANDIIENYYKEYASGKGVLLAAVKSDALDALAAATADVIKALDTYPTTALQTYCTYASTTGYKPEYYDMGSCIYHWAGQDVYDAWAEVLHEAVPYKYFTTTWLTSYSSVFTPRIIDSDHVALVSMYFPLPDRDLLNATWREYEWYNDVGHLFER